MIRNSISIRYRTKYGYKCSAFLISKSTVTTDEAIEHLKSHWLNDSNYSWMLDPWFKIDTVFIHPIFN